MHGRERKINHRDYIKRLEHSSNKRSKQQAAIVKLWAPPLPPPPLIISFDQSDSVNLQPAQTGKTILVKPLNHGPLLTSEEVAVTQKKKKFVTHNDSYTRSTMPGLGARGCGFYEGKYCILCAKRCIIFCSLSLVMFLAIWR